MAGTPCSLSLARQKLVLPAVGGDKRMIFSHLSLFELQMIFISYVEMKAFGAHGGVVRFILGQ